MTLFQGIIILFALLLTGVPMYTGFLIVDAMLNEWLCEIPVSIMGSHIFEALNSWTIMAVPFFILVGELMGKTKLAHELIDVTDSFVGWMPGGQAVTLVSAVTLFGAISGSGIAAIAAIGLIVVPAMIEKGYPKYFCIALSASSAQIGVLIPPSIPLILFGEITQSNVAALFAAGVFPGLLLATLLIVYSVIQAKRHHWPQSKVYNWQERKRILISGIPALFLPVVILGGIYGGIFSPTEAAVVGCAYALLYGFVRKRLSLNDMKSSFVHAATVSGMVFLLVAATVLFGKIMIFSRVPNLIIEGVVELGLTPTVFMLMVIGLYLVIGCFAEVIVITLVSVPILFPVMQAIGVDMYCFAIIVTTAVVVAGITPPVGVNLFAACAVFRAPANELLKEIWPFFIIEVIFLFIVAFVPVISTWLPKALGY